jgi:two-component system, NarL family, sensor histidine kinase BarA
MRELQTLQGVDIEGIGMGPVRLDDLVDREALGELARSFERLFGIPVRILSSSGSVLAEAASQAPICALVNEHEAGRAACRNKVTDVAELSPVPGQSAAHTCFTGAVYRILPIEYDGRAIGRIVLGPYIPIEREEAPPELYVVDPQLDRRRAQQLWPSMARARPELIQQISEHLRATLDLILFSGHKALLTSTMHIASMKESFRELNQKTDELQEAYDRLQEVDRLKSNFLATMSHELRTPLTSIIGYSEMLAEGIGGELNQEQREFVHTIRAKGEQLLGLIMSLLDLSKLESGTAVVERSDVKIRDVLREAVSTLAPTAAKKGVTLAVQPGEDPPRVLGNADRLRQVFINLAENAIKFTPPGGRVDLSVRTVSEEPAFNEPGLILVAPLQKLVEVRVTDTGMGIPESQRERVFDPFYQVDQSSTREHGGTGLGLSIVKRLVEAHQGRISIEANEPRGAVFVVTLPIVPSRTSAPPPSRKSLPPIFR